MMTFFRPYFVNIDTLFRRTFWRLKSNFRTSFEKLEMCCKVIFSLSRALFLYFRGNYEKRKKGVSSDFYVIDHFLILIFV